jgi:hypothetical protein
VQRPGEASGEGKKRRKDKQREGKDQEAINAVGERANIGAPKVGD